MKQTEKAKPEADRVILQGEARDRINRWLDQLNEGCIGPRLTRNELVGYLITARNALLSPEEVHTIRQTFFDDVRFAAWLLRELKAAKAKKDAQRSQELLQMLSQRSSNG